MAKRSHSDDLPFDPELDTIRKQEFFDKHVEPGESEYYKNITIKRSDAEIKHRLELIQTFVDDRDPRENFIFNNNMNYNGANSGLPLSNILLSFMLNNVVKVPEIDLKVYIPSVDGLFVLNLKNENSQDITKEITDKNKEALKQYVLNWIQESQLLEHVRECSSKESRKYHTRSVSRKSHVTMDSRVIVIRRCAILNLQLLFRNKSCGHCVLIYWQLRKNTTDYILEYGICDNLRLFDYDTHLGMNFDFHVEIMQSFQKYFTDHPLGQIQHFYRFILNPLRGITFDQEHHKQMRYTCIPVSRRAILYFAIFYDIFKLNDNKDIEHRVAFSDMSLEHSLTPQQILFIKNFKAYTHYMNRMMDWLLKSPLIWPLYDPSFSDASEPKHDMSMPLCIVLFAEEYMAYTTPVEYLKWIKSSSKSEPFFIEMNKDKAYLILCNVIDNSQRRYYFQWEGDEVFRPEPYPAIAPQDTCTVSTQFKDREIYSIVSMLHARLLRMELKDACFS